MLQKSLIISLFALTLNAAAFAETYWLNMPGSYSEKHQEYTPSISMPLVSSEECNKALEQFAQDNEMVELISCDLRPISGAINLAGQWASN